MKTAVAFLALAGAASAFAPASTVSSKNGLQMASSVFDDYVGAVDFRGKEFKFDPLSLSETYSPFVPYFRESELRHCRTAMLAVAGYIVADFVRVPGEAYSFASVSQVAAAHDAIPEAMIQIAAWIALFDIVITAPAISATFAGERDAGDFGFDPLGFMKNKSPAEVKLMKEKELLNGRLAMMAIGGIATQAVLTGHGFPYL